MRNPFLIEAIIPPEVHVKAKELALDFALKNSIKKGEGNVMAVIGELMYINLLSTMVDPTAIQHPSTFDYDIVFDGIKIDVKTKKRRVIPQSHYENSVAAFNTKQQCDQYVFVSLMDREGGENFTHAHFAGCISKKRFYKRAAFRKAGELDGDNNVGGQRFRIRADCYNLKIGELTQLEEDMIPWGNQTPYALKKIPLT